MNEIFNNQAYYKLVEQLNFHKKMYLSSIKDYRPFKLYNKYQLYRMYYIIPTLTHIELYVRDELDIYTKLEKENKYFIVISNDSKNNIIHISDNSKFISLCRKYDAYYPVKETQIAILESEITKITHQRRVLNSLLYDYKEKIKQLKEEDMQYNYSIIEKYNNITMQFFLLILNNITELKICNKCLSKLYSLKYEKIKNNIHNV